MKVFTKNSNPPKASANKAKDKAQFFGVQAKLRIGKADDPYERQADSVAEKVVSNNERNAQIDTSTTPFFGSNQSANVQRKPLFTGGTSIAKSITPGVSLQAQTEEEPQAKLQRSEEDEAQAKIQLMPFEDVQKAEDEEAQTKVQLMPFEDVQKAEDEEAQAKLAVPDMPKVDISKKIQSKKGTGDTMPEEAKGEMEAGFGADFGDVQIHNDSESAGMNKDLGAKAFTSGNDIFFNEGQFKPESKEGKTLLAHELTHTIQQGASGAKDTVTPEDPNADPNQAAQGVDGAGAGAGDAAQPEDLAAGEEQAIEGEVPIEEVPVVEGEGELDSATEGEGEGEDAGGPTTPRSPEEDPNFQQLEGRVETTSGDQQAHEEPSAAAGSAQGAAASPPNERDSMAQAGQVDAMDEAEPEEFSAEAFKAQLMERISSMQLPSNPDEADNFDDNNNIDEVNDAATQDASGAQAAAAGPVQSTTSAEPNVEAVPEREVTPLPEPPIGEAPPSVNPATAMPPQRGNSEVNQPLQENMGEVDDKMAENEITDEQLEKSNEPKFMAGLEAKGKAKEHADNAPAGLRQQEQGILANAQVNADTQAQTGLDGMHQDRATAMGDVNLQQGQTGETDTAERTRIAGEINVIYENAKTEVEQILSDLDETVATKFTAGTARAKTLFENYVERKMDAYKDRRYSGLRGAARWVVDKFAGMPEEVNEFFTEGRQVYIDHMDVVITEVSNIVAAELTRAKARVNQGKQEVQDYVTSLPENLQQIGSDAAEEISTKFDELEESVNAKQEELISNLADAYMEGLEAVDARIEEMQAANRGLIDMALGAIMGIIQTIIDIKNMLTDLLMGAIGAIMTIISDPIGFLTNLFGGIKQGFEQFGSNILTHLQTALIQWLTGALGPVGITMPDDLFSLKGIFSLVAQILGLTWDYIRQKAVQHLGEPVVVALETGFEIFQIIRTGGIDGLWEYLKEQFNDLKETVIDAIKEMVITTVIEAGIKWVLGLLNPASAFVKACMMIIDVVRFFIERGSQIVQLVQAFIEGVNATASGNVTAVANAIENALARALPVIIGFMASLLGISGLARKVTKLIGKIRKRVDKAVEKLIKKAKAAGRRLLASMGVGRNADGAPPENEGDQRLEDNEVGKTVNFNAEGESHRLWIQVNGNNVEVMVASTPTPVPVKIQFFRDRKESLPQDKQGQATGFINEANQSYQTVLQKAQQTNTEMQQAEQNPTDQEIRQAEAKDQETEDAEVVLKGKLSALFALYGDEGGVTDRFSQELSLVHPQAHDAVMDELLNNNAEYADIQSWSAVKAKLLAKDPASRPLRKQHTFGAYTFNNQAIPQLTRATGEIDGYTPAKLRPATSISEYIDNRVPSIHGGQSDKGRLVKEALQDEFFNNGQEGSANSALFEYFKAALLNQGEHNLYAPQNTQVSIEDGQFFLRYDYGQEAEELGQRDFMVRFNLRDAEQGIIDQSTTGRNLTLKESGSRGRTASAGQVAVAGFSDLNSAHVLADWFTGSGYKGALNLIATSAHYNQEIMFTAEESLANQIAAFTRSQEHIEPTITTQIQVDATWQALSQDKVVDHMKAVEGSKGKTQEELDLLAQSTYTKLRERQFPRRCLRVRYQARMVVGGATTSLRFSEQIGPDNWLTL